MRTLRPRVPGLHVLLRFGRLHAHHRDPVAHLLDGRIGTAGCHNDVMPDPSTLQVGEFRFWFLPQRWEWSDEVALMHGYAPGTVTPTTELLLSHKHPEDRQHVQELLDRALHSGG